MRKFSVLLSWICSLLIPIAPALAENYLLQGGQVSDIDYTMDQEIVPFPGVTQITLGYVIPKDFMSPSYRQDVQSFDVRFSVPPARQRRTIDLRGNEIVEADWLAPKDPIRISIRLHTLNETRLEPLQTRALFPPERIPLDARVYLTATRQVPSTRPDIVETARRLTADSETEFDAVQHILTWLVDKMQYTLRPGQFDAGYAMQTGRGNCQNYSHLAAALMRSVGIPVRIVNGVTLKEAYDMEVTGGWMTMRMAQGRHSWIEVYFSDLGWVPFDPQQMQMFVSNRFIRIEVGLDNQETIKDGAVRWRRTLDAPGQPRFQETIATRFLQDNNRVTAERQTYGPHKLLLSPRVESTFSIVAFEAEAAPTAFPTAPSPKAFTRLDTVGNLEFPLNVDFMETRTLVQTPDSDEMTLEKNFIVETAEYVTTQGQKYAQTFILKEPMLLEKIGLALHKFGGTGQIWIELMDDDSGKPNRLLASSDWTVVETMRSEHGYNWVDFRFPGEPKIIPPGRYWIAFAYTGSPVVNWFFTYAKNTGPSDGTRYRNLFDEQWSRSLAYEFNYRVIGRKMP